MSRTLVIFDLDGTLFRTGSSVIPAVQASLGDIGLDEADEDRIISLIGEKTDTFCRRLLGDQEDRFDEFMDRLWVYEKKYVSERGELYDGVEEMLGELKEDGYELIISSNGSQEYVDYVVEATGIAPYFTEIRGNSEDKTKGDVIGEMVQGSDSSQAIMMGDKSHDMEAASQNGIPFIGVTYGYGDEELEGARFTVDSAQEIPEKVRDIVRTLR